MMKKLSKLKIYYEKKSYHSFSPNESKLIMMKNTLVLTKIAESQFAYENYYSFCQTRSKLL